MKPITKTALTLAAAGILAVGIKVRVPLTARKYLDDVRVLTNDKSVFVFSEWESDSLSPTFPELLGTMLLRLPFNPDHVHAQTMVNLSSYSILTGTKSETIRLTKSRLGAVWPLSSESIVWQDIGKYFGWDGTKVFELQRDQITHISEIRSSNYPKYLSDRGWRMIESGIDPNFIFGSDGLDRTFQVKVGNVAVNTSICGGKPGYVQKSEKVDIDGVRVFEFP